MNPDWLMPAVLHFVLSQRHPNRTFLKKLKIYLFDHIYLKHENPRSALQTSGVRFSCVLREMLYTKKIMRLPDTNVPESTWEYKITNNNEYIYIKKKIAD